MEREDSLARLERARELCRRLNGPEAAAALGQLDTEMDRIEATLDWLQAQGDTEEAFQLAGALHPYWMERGRCAEGRTRLQRLLRAATDVPCPARLAALHAACVLALRQGDREAARWLARQGLELAETLGDKDCAALARLDLGWAALGDGAVEEALAHAEAAWTHFAAAGDTEHGTLALQLVAEAERMRGDVARSRHFCAHVLAFMRQHGRGAAIAVQLCNLAGLARVEGHTDEADRLLREAFAHAQRAGGVSDEARILAGLGCVAIARGDARRAALLLSAAQARLAELDEVLDPADQFDMDRALAQVRAALDPVSFEAAWTQGTALRAADALTLTGVAR